MFRRLVMPVLGLAGLIVLISATLLPPPTGSLASTDLRKAPPKTITVVIDPGHGGKDPGNLPKKKGFKQEKALNLLIAKKLGEYLTTRLKGIKVVYTRTTDKTVSLEDRAELANRIKADYFISIHCNSNPIRAVKGTRVHIHSHKFKVSQRLGKRVEQEFRTRAGRQSRGMMDARDRGYNLYVLQYTKMPGVLLELGFMSNISEEKYLNSDYGQDILASAIFRAFRAFIKKEHGEREEDRSTIYRVQIMASDKPIPLDHRSFVKLGLKVEEHTVKGDKFPYKYVVGWEYEKTLAQKLARKIMGEGFKDAFVIKLSES